MASSLEESLVTISKMGLRLFDGVYSHTGFELYDAENDELMIAISGIDNKTQQIFNLSIAPRYVANDSRLHYNVELSYFKQLRGSATVSADLLLDFLINARVSIENQKKEIFLNYVSSNLGNTK